MLTFKPNPLSQVEQGLIKALPALEGYRIMKRVIAAKVDESALETAKAVADSSKFDAFDEKALKLAEKTRKFQTCLDVLEEMEQQTTHYTTSLTV